MSTHWHVILAAALALEITVALAGENQDTTAPPPRQERTECRKLVGQNYVPCDELAWLQADA
jgi:hypothetical protein